jgi:predicted GH43/DUF377 family glycosyl hydrolase
MNHKPQAILRLGASILVLAAFILTPHGTLAEPQPSQIPLPNQKAIVNSCVDSTLACSGAQILPGPFTKSTENPILEPGGAGSWEENGAIRPSVTWADGTYRMWYAGSNASFTSAIGYATSTNGTVWTKEATNPVLENGDPGTWDDYSVSFATVIQDGGGYKMWYTGTGPSAGGIGSVRKIGMANSLDGIIWTKYAGNPVLDVGPTGDWDASQVSIPTVYKTGSGYHMWYSVGISGVSGIGHATSPDGTTWTKDPANPVIPGNSGGWDDIAFAPFVLYDGCFFQMFYSGCDSAGDICQVGYARSLDGTTWTRRGAVLPMGSGADFDSGLVGYPGVMLGIPYYRLFYTGALVDEPYHIGLAIALRLDKEIFLPAIIK